MSSSTHRRPGRRAALAASAGRARACARAPRAVMRTNGSCSGSENRYRSAGPGRRLAVRYDAHAGQAPWMRTTSVIASMRTEFRGVCGHVEDSLVSLRRPGPTRTHRRVQRRAACRLIRRRLAREETRLMSLTRDTGIVGYESLLSPGGPAED